MFIYSMHEVNVICYVKLVYSLQTLLLCTTFTVPKILYYRGVGGFPSLRGGGLGLGGWGGVWGVGDTFCVILKIIKFEFFREGPEPPPSPS